MVLFLLPSEWNADWGRAVQTDTLKGRWNQLAAQTQEQPIAARNFKDVALRALWFACAESRNHRAFGAGAAWMLSINYRGQAVTVRERYGRQGRKGPQSLGAWASQGHVRGRSDMM